MSERSKDPRHEQAEQAAAAMAAGVAPTRVQYDAARALLIGSLTSRYARTGLDVTDVVDSALEKFLAATASPGKVRPETAWAYLRTITRNEAISRFRRTARELSVGDDQVFERPGDDDAIARLIDERSNAAIVERVIAVRAAAGDWRATRVINEFIALVEAHGRTPSLRDVAEHAEVTHPTVSRVLRDVLRDIRNDKEGPFPLQ